jgi:hypothetical protein
MRFPLLSIYRSMYTPNKSSNEYARCTSLIVCLPVAQDILFATLVSSRQSASRTPRLIPVFYLIERAKLHLPHEHWIDRFEKLGAAALIDTASVYPDIVVSVFVSLDTTTFNLRIAWHVTGVRLVNIRELYLTPSMREYCILWDLTEKLFSSSFVVSVFSNRVLSHR